MTVRCLLDVTFGHPCWNTVNTSMLVHLEVLAWYSGWGPVSMNDASLTWNHCKAGILQRLQFEPAHHQHGPWGCQGAAHAEATQGARLHGTQNSL